MIHRFLLVNVLLASVLCSHGMLNQDDNGEARPINRNPINIIAVGYDIANNQAAQKMLFEIGEAARETGVAGEVIMAGEDEAELGQAMERAMNIALNPAGRPVLSIKTPEVRVGQPIVVVHSEFTIDNQHAWIGFYEKADAPDQDYISYTFLGNLTDRVYDVIAPRRPGREYHFRIFLSEAYDAAARSEAVSVKP